MFTPSLMEPSSSVLNPSQKELLMKDILVLESLIDTYSRIDPERIPALKIRIKALEYKLLDILVVQNEEWLEMFKEQNCNC